VPASAAQPTAAASQAKPEDGRKIVPLPDDRLLGAHSREERDVILEALVRWIVSPGPQAHYLLGFETAVRGWTTEEGIYRYNDPSPQLRRALADLGPRVQPLSVAGGPCWPYGIIILQLFVASPEASVEVRWGSVVQRYFLHFDNGAWHVTVKEDIQFFK
jgi:hypothetical protein